MPGAAGTAAWIELQESEFPSIFTSKPEPRPGSSNPVKTGHLAAEQRPTSKAGLRPAQGFCRAWPRRVFSVTAQARQSPGFATLSTRDFSRSIAKIAGWPEHSRPPRPSPFTTASIRVCNTPASRRFRRCWSRRCSSSRTATCSDPEHPKHNPAVDWGRLAGSLWARPLRQVNLGGGGRAGGSTLATQIEKFRHSPAAHARYRRQIPPDDVGRPARLPGWRGNPAGPPPHRARFRQFGAARRHSWLRRVNGLGDGLWAWYGRTSPRSINCWPTPRLELSERALAFKQGICRCSSPSAALPACSATPPAASTPDRQLYPPARRRTSCIPADLREARAQGDRSTRRARRGRARRFLRRTQGGQRYSRHPERPARRRKPVFPRPLRPDGTHHARWPQPASRDARPQPSGRSGRIGWPAPVSNGGQAGWPSRRRQVNYSLTLYERTPTANARAHPGRQPRSAARHQCRHQARSRLQRQVPHPGFTCWSLPTCTSATPRSRPTNWPS